MQAAMREDEVEILFNFDHPIADVLHHSHFGHALTDCRTHLVGKPLHTAEYGDAEARIDRKSAKCRNLRLGSRLL
jgi:hypothetical protein